MANAYRRYWDHQDRVTQLRRLCRGLHASFDGVRLTVTKDGRKFTGYTIGSSRDWKSGQFSICNELVFSWDRSTGSSQGVKHCWAYYAPMIVEMINRYAEEAKSYDRDGRIIGSQE